jgi:hypothetical protein
MCPTCDATMANLGLDQAGRRVFWCNRCGTVKTETAGVFNPDSGDPRRETFTESESPLLVRRCREFEKHEHGLAIVGPRTRRLWVSGGIADAINLPADRSTSL